MATAMETVKGIRLGTYCASVSSLLRLYFILSIFIYEEVPPVGGQVSGKLTLLALMLSLTHIGNFAMIWLPAPHQIKKSKGDNFMQYKKNIEKNTQRA
jgi:hypothetical protein